MIGTGLSLKARLVFGAVGMVVLLASAVVALRATVPSYPGAHYLNATFGRVGQGLDTSSDVKVRGITVGKVAAVTLNRHGQVVVRLRIDRGNRVPDTAVASVEPVSVFGPKIINLDPGDHEDTGPYLANGASVSRTRDALELADTLKAAYKLAAAVDPQELAVIVHTLARGVEGRGPAARKALDDGQKLLDIATRDLGGTKQFLSDVSALSDTLGSRGDQFVGIARNINNIAPELTANPDKVDELLARSAGLAGRLTANIQRNRKGIQETRNAGEKATAVIYSQLPQLPELIKSLGVFFGTVGGALNKPGPKGTLMGSAEFRLSSGNPCEIVVDLCMPPELPR